MMTAPSPVVLIPAYRPGPGLPQLIRELRAADRGLDVLVVDDGSGPEHADIFRAAADLGAEVLRHDDNRGKGSALRTGFRHLRDRFPGRSVVCADADGQHAVADVLRVAAAVRAGSRTMVLGVREFGPEVPLRSRFGNGLTRVLYRLATGARLADTQTGLRGYPPELLDWLLSVPGRRYEYELNLLLRARSAEVSIETVPISTIYLDGNAESHFRPIVDSARIYGPLLMFALSSLAAFLLDTVALLVLAALTGSLLVAVIGARVISSTTNYLINRRVVFPQGRRLPVAVTAMRYFALVAVLLMANYALLTMLTGLGIPLLAAKVLTELALFGVSYAVQAGLVFGAGRRSRLRGPAGVEAARRAEPAAARAARG